MVMVSSCSRTGAGKNHPDTSECYEMFLLISSTMVLPAGAYVPSDPNRKRTSIIDPRVLGLPHTTMATLCLSHSAHRLPMTPLHLRGNLPPPVDFTSHIRPPTKVGNKEILVQVYAVAVDELDVMSVEEKGKGEVGKWVPGRSFVGRCLGVGGEEKEIVRGEIVVGLLDIRKVRPCFTETRIHG